MKKLNHYTELEARTLSERGDGAARKGLFWKPLAVFFYRAFLQFGIADGREGLTFSALSAYYDFVRLAKYIESNLKNGAIV